MVTLTYGYRNAYFTDCDSTTGWVETEDGLTCALTVDNRDYLKLDATVAVGNKTAYYTYNFTDFSSNTYPKFLARYKTSDNSIKAKIVLDLFAGSGSTLIACELLQRIGRMMELDPKYCDVIIKRWQDFTGKKATMAGDTYDEIAAARGVKNAKSNAA